MPRSYHYPQRDPVTGEMGHWEGTIYDGAVVDVWVRHCHLHIHTVEPCEHCAASIGIDEGGE